MKKLHYKKNKKVSHGPINQRLSSLITRLGGTALYCYAVITVVRGCIPFFKREEMVVEGGQQKKKKLVLERNCNKIENQNVELKSSISGNSCDDLSLFCSSCQQSILMMFSR